MRGEEDTAMQMREHSPSDFPALDLIHMWVVRLRSYLMASYGSGGKCCGGVVRRYRQLPAGVPNLLGAAQVHLSLQIPSSSVEVAVNGSGSDKVNALSIGRLDGICA